MIKWIVNIFSFKINKFRFQIYQTNIQKFKFKIKQYNVCFLIRFWKKRPIPQKSEVKFPRAWPLWS